VKTFRLLCFLWREFQFRWPAIESILRDGTVIYKARIVGNTLEMERQNSMVMENYLEGVTVHFKPGTYQVGGGMTVGPGVKVEPSEA
jgi:hypothetical protein